MLLPSPLLHAPLTVAGDGKRNARLPALLVGDPTRPAGADGVFHPARATIVEYNLFNHDGLPATPFATDFE